MRRCLPSHRIWREKACGMLHSSSAQSNISRARSRISRSTTSDGQDEWGIWGNYSCWLTAQQLMQPALHRQTHFCEMALEEVVAGDEHQFLRIGSRGDHLFQRFVRAELVMVAADEELGLGTLAEKRKRIDTAVGCDGSPKRYQGSHVCIGTAGAQPGRGTEGESGKDDRHPEFPFQPRQRGLYVGDLAASLVVLADAQSRSAEVESQNRKAKEC